LDGRSQRGGLDVFLLHSSSLLFPLVYTLFNIVFGMFSAVAIDVAGTDTLLRVPPSVWFRSNFILRLFPHLGQSFITVDNMRIPISEAILKVRQLTFLML